MASNDESLQKITDSARLFLSAESTLPADRDMVIKLLDARPPMAKIQHALPADEIEHRLRLAADIQDLRWRIAQTEEDYDSLRLTAFEVSAIMLAPMDKVNGWLERGDSGQVNIGQMIELVRICMPRP